MERKKISLKLKEERKKNLKLKKKITKYGKKCPKAERKKIP